MNGHALQSNQWLQGPIARQAIVARAPDVAVQLDLGQNWRTKHNRALSAALAPHCQIACVAFRKCVNLYALHMNENRKCKPEVLKFDSVEDAIVSNDVLAVLTSSAVELSQIGNVNGKVFTRLLLQYPLDCSRGWMPLKIAMANSRRGPRLIVGGNCLCGPEIQLYDLLPDGDDVKLKFRTQYSVAAIDSIKSLVFDPNGESIVAVMDSTRCIAWHVRTNIRDEVLNSNHIEIIIPQKAQRGLLGGDGTLPENFATGGMTAASLFRSPSSRQKFIFCAAARARGSAQRCQISPLPPDASVGELASAAANQHSMSGDLNPMVDYAEPIVAATVSPDGRYIAVVEKEGRIRLFRTQAHPNGGLYCEDCEPAATSPHSNAKLCTQSGASPASIQINEMIEEFTSRLEIMAIDTRGKVVLQTYVVR